MNLLYLPNLAIATFSQRFGFGVTLSTEELGGSSEKADPRSSLSSELAELTGDQNWLSNCILPWYSSALDLKKRSLSPRSIQKNPISFRAGWYGSRGVRARRIGLVMK